jgi:hypothetical protein
MSARTRRYALILWLALAAVGLGRSAQAFHSPEVGSSLDIALGALHLRMERGVSETGGQIVEVSLAVHSLWTDAPVLEVRRAIAIP